MEPKPLPIDEHALIGLELCAMRERLSILALRIDNSYGKEIGNSGRKAAAAVDSFREVMNEQVEQACPALYASTLTGVYHCTERLSALRQENEPTSSGRGFSASQDRVAASSTLEYSGMFLTEIRHE